MHALRADKPFHQSFGIPVVAVLRLEKSKAVRSARRGLEPWWLCCCWTRVHLKGEEDVTDVLVAVAEVQLDWRHTGTETKGSHGADTPMNK